MIHFILIVNSQGKIRLSSHFSFIQYDERILTEADIIRKCLARKEDECFVFDYRNLKTVYRRYSNLMVIVAASSDENELAVYEFIQLLMETLEDYFHNLTETQILYNLDKVHMILQEMIINGKIVGTSIKRNLAIISVLDRLSTK